MGVYEEKSNRGLTMHWQQNERYISNAYEPSRELSPGTPAAGGTSSPPSPRDCTACHKREPPDEPSTPPAGCSGERCAGCGALITDRYYLHACERRWHVPCLRCCKCKCQLDSERSCYARDGNIFCKNDYYRLFGTKRCSRCQTAISASEMVMRARDLVFHVHCFSCTLCNAPLTKGDTFGIRDAAVYCRLHYDTMPEYGPHMGMPGAPQMCPGYAPGAPPPMGPHYPPYPSPEFARAEPPDGPKAFFNGASAPPPRQKGRPRKKKPKDQEIMTANMGVVPERTSQMAAHGDQARWQDVRQVFPRSEPGAGLHVPRIHGWLHPVSATAQSAVQCHGRSAKSKLHGLPLAPAVCSVIHLLPAMAFKAVTVVG